MATKEEILDIHKGCIGLRVFIVTKGGFYATIRSVIDENTFEVINDAGHISRADLYDIRGLSPEIAPPIQNSIP